MGKQLKECFKLEFSIGQVLAEGLGLPKKLDLWRILLAKGVVMLVAMSFFHLCLEFFSREVLAIV